MRRTGVAGIWLVAFVFVLSCYGRAQTDPGWTPERIVQQQIDELPTGDLYRFLRSLDAEVQPMVPPLDIRGMIFEGKTVPWNQIGRRIMFTLTSHVHRHVYLLGQLIVLGMFCALLKNVASRIGAAQAREASFFLCLLLLLLLGVHVLQTAVQLASTALHHMVQFMLALLPVLSTLLVSVGAVTTAAVFHPVLYVTVTGISFVVHNLVFPLVLVTAVLSVLGSLSKEFPLRQLSGLVRSGAMLVLGICFLAFFAVMKTRGALAPVADGFALRTAKFLTGAFVPVVGGRLADALDVIVGGSTLIKSAVGVFGMGVIVALTALPVVKIFVMLVTFKLAAALIEPLTDERFVQAMAGLANTITLVLAGVVTTALMFFIAITVVVSVGNTTAFMR